MPNDDHPRWTPTQRELDDLDLLLDGCLTPDVTGFEQPAGDDRAAISLVVDKEAASAAADAGQLDLVDPEGAPLATLTVTGSWQADEDQVGLCGPVERLAANEFGPFRRLHTAPADLHQSVAADSLLAVPVTRALSEAEITEVAERAAVESRRPLLLACVGESMPEDISGPALVRATIEAAALAGRDAVVVPLSAADHGSTAANDWLLRTVAAAYATSTLVLESRDTESPLPESIAAIVAKDRPPRSRQGAVIFFTGLSGSGKSTLARALVDHVLEQGERTVTSLDGDVVRHHLSKELGFSREDRETNILRIGFVAAEVARHGGLAVCSPIAPFEATRQEVRRMVERAGGGFVLIHVATPLEECERRDRKGLYAKARAGEIPEFTGISSPYEEPTEGIAIDTTSRDIADCLQEILDALVTEGWLSR